MKRLGNVAKRSQGKRSGFEKYEKKKEIRITTRLTKTTANLKNKTLASTKEAESTEVLEITYASTCGKSHREKIRLALQT